MKTACLFTVAFVLVGASARADLITVDDDGPADFDTIQAAIDFAVGGDVVLVQPGAYVEAIDFLGKAIAVRSALGPLSSSIKAPPDADSPTVTFASKEGTLATISGFKIGGGNGRIIEDPVFGPSLAGGAIFCYEASPQILNCDMVGNTIDGHGAGMLVMRGSPTITNCTFTGNEASGHGGGIYILDNSSPRITECQFHENSASWGGAITCTVSCHPVIEDCGFTGNDVANVGGAVYIRSSSDPTFTNCTFVNNLQVGNPTSGGAAVTIYGSGNGGGPCYPVLTACRFDRNDAQAYGGAVHAAYSGNVTLIDCALVNNIAGLNGGAVACLGHAKAPTSVLLSGCQIEGNIALASGGGVDSRTATVAIENCTITQNLSGPATGSGGGCRFELSEASSILDSVICANTPDQVAGSFQDDGGNSIQAECPGECIADINDDGIVDGADLTLVLGEWGDCPTEGECPADLTGDGIVDGADLTIVLGAWGPCP